MTHTCHWPSCTRAVPSAMWGCKSHWFTLPKNLRDLVWRFYTPGQEVRKDPSENYLTLMEYISHWCNAFDQKDKEKCAYIQHACIIWSNTAKETNP